MIERPTIEHHIQKFILMVLMHQKVARFRDLRPPKIDTNLFSYHLKSLIKAGYITKLDKGYTLSRLGLIYIDRLSEEKVNIREQPKIITMIKLTNKKHEVLLQKRSKQPYIDTWTLPYGKLHMEDESLLGAAKREANEKLGLADLNLVRAGDCYIRVFSREKLLTCTLAHIFTGKFDGEISSAEPAQFVAPRDLPGLPLAPAVEHIVELSSAKTPFFAELHEDWYTKDI